MIKNMVRSALKTLGLEIRRTRSRDPDLPWTNPPYSLKHQRIRPKATYSPWLGDPEFLCIYNKVANHTLVDIYRCYELWSAAKSLRSIDGDILEVGVWRGGTGAILCKAIEGMRNKKAFLADTFSGVVKAGPLDTYYKGGEHSDTSEAQVIALLQSQLLDNAEILKGIFPDETGHRPRGKISLLHCDVDVYESTKAIVEWTLPRLSIGGMMIFDDYGFSGCEGVTRYCNELAESFSSLRLVHNLNGHAVFLKLGDQT